MKKKGIIMVVAIVILLLLTTLAMAMIGIGWVGKITASSYIEKTQSEFMTQGAIELATTKVLMYQSVNLVTSMHADWVFSGEDFNKNGRLDFTEDTNKNGLLDTANVDLQDAVLPSFPNPDVETISVGGKMSIPSFIYRNWGGKNINSYTFIKVVDTSSLICVNNIGNPGLKLMLNNIAEYLNIGKRLGDLLFEYLVTNENIESITLNVLENIWNIEDKNKLNIVLNHISLYCWEDKKVLKPAPSQNILNRIKVQNEEKVEIRRHNEINEPVYSFGIFSPININLAPSIIIKSTLSNLSALSFTPYKVQDIKITDKISKLSELGAFWNYFVDTLYRQQKALGFVKKVALTPEEVDKVVDEIETIRSARLTVGDPFIYNWEEFFIFINNLIGKKILDDEKSTLIFANANPNVYSYKFNPSFSKAMRIDRLSLVDYSTTYTFFPPGIFKIEAYNVVMDKNNQIVARSHRGTYMNLYQTINESTIDDFQKGSIAFADQNTLNKKSLNIGPFPVTLFPNLTFPQFDGFLEFSPVVYLQDPNNVYEKMKNNYGPIFVENLTNNSELKKLLKFNYAQINKSSVVDYSLLWDGVDYGLLDGGLRNQYVKILSNLFQAISESALDYPVNLCFWIKLQVSGDLDQDVLRLFNIAGFVEKEELPFNMAFFAMRKWRHDFFSYNILGSSYNLLESSFGSFTFDYFVTNHIMKPLKDINSPYPGIFSPVCLSIHSDSIELYINGNYVKKQTDKMEQNIELEKLLGNINVGKTLTNIFFNGTMDYIIYLIDGKTPIKDNQDIIKKRFPQRYCMDCKDISYTTRSYRIYTVDRNCIMNLYWTDNATETNLPEIYTIVERYSLFESNVLDKNNKVLNDKPYDISIGDNSNGMVCTDEFKIQIYFDPSQKKEKVLESPIIEDLYIMVAVPKYKQILFSESERFK